MNMTEVKTAYLVGAALDWAVGIAVKHESVEIDLLVTDGKPLGVCLTSGHVMNKWQPSADWAQGGPLISEHLVTVGSDSGNERLVYWAYAGVASDGFPCAEGDTHLIAAMSAIVAAKLGDVVSVPSELLEKAE